MTKQSTIDKLIEMRLTAMADAFRIQMDDPAMKEVPFEDRFGMDRISYDSYKIDIESVDPSKDLSMREVYGLDPAMAK